MAEKKENKQPEVIKKKIVGVDCGTMNLVAAENEEDKVKINCIRNAFITVPPDLIKASQISDTHLNYIEIKNEDDSPSYLAVVGEDAFKMAAIFGSELRRPMSDGVISKGDQDSADVLTRMLQSLVGVVPGGKCVFSVPAQAIDVNMAPVTYHQRMFKKMFNAIGYDDVDALNEAQAIIFSECANSNFSGIAISYGSGMQNFNLSWKGVSISSFSLARSGDWIDKCVAEATNCAISRVTNIKEQSLDLSKDSFKDHNKNEKRILEALSFFYQDLIEYSVEKMVEKFSEVADDLETNEEIPIIISGGTSLPNGFDVKFKETFNSYKFPYKISEIRRASDPLNAVARGCLIYAYWLENKK